MANITDTIRWESTYDVISSGTPWVYIEKYGNLNITALATNITSVNVTWVPVDFQELNVRIKDNGSARTITWWSQFASRWATLPTTTVASKILHAQFIYSSTAGTWWCINTSYEDSLFTVTPAWYVGILNSSPQAPLDVTWSIRQSETSARAWAVSTRTWVTTYPVPSLRPSSSNSVIALDLMPNWTPSEDPSNWYAWFDVCDADILTWTPACQFWRFWIRSTELEIGTKQINGGVALPISYTINGTKVMRMTTDFNVVIWNTTSANARLDVRVDDVSWDAVHIAITDSWWSANDRKRVLQTYSATTPLSSIDAYTTVWTGVDWRFSVYNAGRVADAFVMNYQGRFGVWVTSPTALIHLKAWTATAWTAPLKFTAWTNLTAVENWAMEYDGTNLYFTTGWTRRTVTLV